MKLAVLGVFGSMLVFGATAHAAAVKWSENGHLYEVVRAAAGISWDAANTAAMAEGGYLATITSQAESAFVFGLANNSIYWRNGSGPWLGGYQYPAASPTTSNWRWVTDEPWAYTNWQAGQPNDSGGKAEDKLQYGFGAITATWNDIMSIDPNPNFIPIAYVVEYVPEPVVVAGDADRNGKVDVFDVAVLQQRYGMTAGATWADGDFDDNGTVDIFDVALMQVNYGYGVASSLAPVPEPSTLVLAGLGAMAFVIQPIRCLTRSQRRRRS